MFYVTLMQINVVKIYIQFHIPTGVLSFPGDTEAKSAMVLPTYSFYTNFERGPANLITRDQWLLLQRIVCRHLFMKIHNKTFVNLPVICLKYNFIKVLKTFPYPTNTHGMKLIFWLVPFLWHTNINNIQIVLDISFMWTLFLFQENIKWDVSPQSGDMEEML